MVGEAEKYKEADEQQRERIAAKNGLESYCFNMKQTIEDEKLAEKLGDEDKKKISDKVAETLVWLEANQTAEKEEYEHHQKEVEAVCNPIITKLYASAGGAGGAPPGGMPGGAPGAGAAGSGGGPTIEEVD